MFKRVECFLFFLISLTLANNGDTAPANTPEHCYIEINLPTEATSLRASPEQMIIYLKKSCRLKIAQSATCITISIFNYALITGLCVVVMIILGYLFIVSMSVGVECSNALSRNQRVDGDSEIELSEILISKFCLSSGFLAFAGYILFYIAGPSLSILGIVGNCCGSVLLCNANYNLSESSYRKTKESLPAARKKIKKIKNLNSFLQTYSQALPLLNAAVKLKTDEYLPDSVAQIVADAPPAEKAKVAFMHLPHHIFEVLLASKSEIQIQPLLQHFFFLLHKNPERLHQLVYEVFPPETDFNLETLAEKQSSPDCIFKIFHSIPQDLACGLVKIPVLQIINKSFIAPGKPLDVAEKLEICKNFKTEQAFIDDFLAILLPDGLIPILIEYYKLCPQQ